MENFIFCPVFYYLLEIRGNSQINFFARHVKLMFFLNTPTPYLRPTHKKDEGKTMVYLEPSQTSLESKNHRKQIRINSGNTVRVSGKH